jgi:hypothetical protein
VGRSDKAKVDAQDAHLLLTMIDEPLTLSEKQQEDAREALDYVVPLCRAKPRSWWEEGLGLPRLPPLGTGEQSIEEEQHGPADVARGDSDGNMGGEGRDREGESEGEGERDGRQEGMEDDAQSEDIAEDGSELRGSRDVAGRSGEVHTHRYVFLQLNVFGIVVSEIRGGQRSEAGTP